MGGGSIVPFAPSESTTSRTSKVLHASVPLATLFPTEPRVLSYFLHSPAESNLFSLLTIFPNPPNNVAGFWFRLHKSLLIIEYRLPTRLVHKYEYYSTTVCRRCRETLAALPVISGFIWLFPVTPAIAVNTVAVNKAIALDNVTEVVTFILKNSLFREQTRARMTSYCGVCWLHLRLECRREDELTALQSLSTANVLEVHPCARRVSTPSRFAASLTSDWCLYYSFYSHKVIKSVYKITS